MKQYKAISGPQTIDVNAHENISEAIAKYTEFVNEQATVGWEYLSASTITVNKKGGCLRKDSAAKYKMMIFERKETEGSTPLTEIEDRPQVSFETANTENTTDTATHGSAKKGILIGLAVLLAILIGIVVYNVLCGRALFFVGKSKEALSNEFASQNQVESEMNTGSDFNSSDSVTSTVLTDSEGKTKYVEAKSGLVLRSIPSTDGEVLDLIPNGTELTVFSGGNGWAHATYRGQEGWVSENYLRDSKPATSQNEDVLLPTEWDSGGLYQVRAASGLCLRRGPGISYEIILAIPNGSEIPKYAVQYEGEDEWFYTGYEDQFGWVSARYLVWISDD